MGAKTPGLAVAVACFTWLAAMPAVAGLKVSDTAIQDCDRLAPFADDLQRASDPAEWAGIDIGKVVAACARAVDEQPQNTRFLTQYAIALAREQSFKESYDTLRKAVDLGSPTAMAMLGEGLLWGGGIDRDPARGLDLLRRAADAGNGAAMEMIGNAYRMGAGVEANGIMAHRWLYKAAEAGARWSQLELGKAYLHGNEAPKDPDKGRQWIEKAANQGFAQAAITLGEEYADGNVLPKDPQKAASWYLRAMQLGRGDLLDRIADMTGRGEAGADVLVKALSIVKRHIASRQIANDRHDGCQEIVTVYDQGIGVPKNPGQGLDWAMKCVDAGDLWAANFILSKAGKSADADQMARALNALKAQADRGGPDNEAIPLLASAYWNGTGVPQDHGRAVDWYVKGAEAGNKDCFGHLFQLYGSGKIGADIAERATKRLYRMAVDGPYGWPIQKIGDLYADKNGPFGTDDEKAAAWWLTYVRHDHAPWIADKIGKLYAEGKIGPETVATLLEWLRARAALKGSGALSALANLYVKGYGVPKDEKKAADYVLQAVASGDSYVASNMAGIYYDPGNQKTNPENTFKTYLWAKLALRMGGTWSAYMVDEAAANLSPEQIRKADHTIDGYLKGMPAWPDPATGKAEIVPAVEPAILTTTPPIDLPQPVLMKPRPRATPPAPPAAQSPPTAGPATTTAATPGAAEPPAATGQALVLAVQRQLKTLGFDPGPLDGVAGKKTSLAVQAFQIMQGLPPDGRVTPGLMTQLNAAVAPGQNAATTHPTASPMAPPAVDFGRYHALVIGIDRYRNLPPLATAEADARAVADLLGRRYGFEVSLLLDATRSGIIKALDAYRARLTADDNLLIYYAGHGWLDKAAERGYWLPVDAQRASRTEWLSNATITDALKALKARHVLVVADSCYSGTLSRSVRIEAREPGDLLRMIGKKARLVLTSGGLQPVSDSGGGGGHSAFAQAFLNALSENQRVIDAGELFNLIRRPVMVNAPETPEYADIRFAGDEGGNFIFVPAGTN